MLLRQEHRQEVIVLRQEAQHPQGQVVVIREAVLLHVEVRPEAVPVAEAGDNCSAFIVVCYYLWRNSEHIFSGFRLFLVFRVSHLRFVVINTGLEQTQEARLVYYNLIQTSGQ